MTLSIMVFMKLSYSADTQPDAQHERSAKTKSVADRRLALLQGLPQIYNHGHVFISLFFPRLIQATLPPLCKNMGCETTNVPIESLARTLMKDAYVEEPDHYFLKTVIPSRKATRDYLLRSNSDEKT